MAKKRKKTKQAEEEKYEFVPPEFDEKQFLIDEMKATKRVILVVCYGIIFGVIAAIITVVTGLAYLGLLVVLFGFASIKYFLNIVKIDLSKFTRRNWIESGAWFFFTFLAIWVLVVNPPFIDIAPPDVTQVQISICTSANASAGPWITYNYTYNTTQGIYQWIGPRSAPSAQVALQSAYSSGYPVNVTAKVADNGILVGVPSIHFRQDTNDELSYNMTATSSAHVFTYSLSSVAGYLKSNYFTFRIVAQDEAQHTRIFDIAENAEIRIT